MKPFLTADDCKGLNTLSYRGGRFTLSKPSRNVQTSEDDWALEWGEIDQKQAKAGEGFYMGKMLCPKISLRQKHQEKTKPIPQAMATVTYTESMVGIPFSSQSS